MIKLTHSDNFRSRKPRISLASVAYTQLENPSKQNKEISRSATRQSFSCLTFLWQQSYISIDDYLTACKYVELYKIINKIQGGPNGYHRNVVWGNAYETSRLGWIQSELSLLEHNYFNHCSDDEVLRLWKILQKFLNKMPLSYRIKFNELVFNESIPNFHSKEKLYLKAFQKAIPAIKSFMIAFWKQKKP